VTKTLQTDGISTVCKQKAIASTVTTCPRLQKTTTEVVLKIVLKSIKRRAVCAFIESARVEKHCSAYIYSIGLEFLARCLLLDAHEPVPVVMNSEVIDENDRKENENISPPFNLTVLYTNRRLSFLLETANDDDQNAHAVEQRYSIPEVNSTKQNQ
jgi:hypothetical protein